MRALRRLLYPLAACVWLFVAGAATAAPGDLTFDGCLANNSSDGCADLPLDPLSAARAVAASPDGESVYVASLDSGSIAHFFRGPGGQIAWDGCLANDGSQGCGDLPGTPLFGVSGVAVSPDGRSVYAASAAGNSIAHFFRNGPEGQITYDGCLADDPSPGCGDLPGNPLTGASGVAVSPDGKSVYVVSLDRGAIAHFRRDGPDGQIAYAGCVANIGAQDCADLPGTPITGAIAAAVSPDGNSVYVVSHGANSVARLARAAGGELSYDGCLADDASRGCVDLPGSPLTGAAGVAVSQDGASVYVASSGANSVAHFSRAPGGRIAFDGCLADDESRGCEDVPGTPLSTALGVAVSPDGGSVYAAGFQGGIVTRFSRFVGGRIAYDGCLNHDGSQGCVDLPVGSLFGARAVTLSADGRSVYVAAQLSNAVTHFFREPASPRAPDTPSPGPAQPPGAPLPPEALPPQPGPAPVDALAPTITRLTTTNRRFRIGRRATRIAARRVPVGTTFRYTLSEQAAVAVVIERAAPGRRVGGRCQRPTRRLRRRPACVRYLPAGRALTRVGAAGANSLRFSGRIGRRRLRAGLYRAASTASDASGNRSRSAHVRFRIQAIARKER